MRGIHAAGAGFGVAIAAGVGLADGPAARLGAPVTLAAARGQVPGGTPPAPGQPPAGILTQPRPLPQGPTIQEQRNGAVAPPAAQPVPAAPPAATFGSPVPYGQPPAIQTLPPGFSAQPPAYQMLPPGYPAQPHGYAAQPQVGAVAAAPPSVQPGGVPAPDLDRPLVGGGAVPDGGPLGLFLNAPGGGFNGPQRLRLDADFLLWFVKSGNVPPLVTTGPPGSIGALGQPGTRVLFGGDTLGSTLHTGARFGAVYWLDEASRLGLDGNLFFLGRRARDDRFSTATDPLLARPFFNVNQNIPFSEIVAAPGLATGSVEVASDTHLWGADVNFRRHLCGGCSYRLDAFAGFRYLNLSETLTVTEQFVRTPDSPATQGIPNALAGTISDRFRTENHFYGPQVGFTGEYRYGRWFAEGRVAVALGTVFQRVEIDGSQQIVFPTGVQTFPGGLLAVPGNNLGAFSRSRFGVVPEVGFKVGAHLTDRWRVNVGYNFLYLNSAVRPGDQIDQGLDVTRIPNFPLPGAVPPAFQNRPGVPFRTTGVFAQGISFGVSWAF